MLFEVLVFGRVRKIATSAISLVMSVCPSVCVYPSAWNYSTPTERIFMKFCIKQFFLKSAEKIQVQLISDDNNGTVHVQLCTAMYSCVQQCTAVYSDVQQCTAMYSCVQLCTAVYSDVQLCTAMYSCVQLCAAVYIRNII